MARTPVTGTHVERAVAPTAEALRPAPAEAWEAQAGVAAVVDTRPATARAWHIWGTADPEGFAAMGVVETLAHAFDLTQGLGLEFEPPGVLVAPALARLFPGGA